VSYRGTDIVGYEYLIDEIVISDGELLDEGIERGRCLPEFGHSIWG
jgi:hypothetical protein